MANIHKKWWRAALIRAIRTFFQTAVSLIPMAVSIEQVNWLMVSGTALCAGVVSLMTSLAGLPEVDENEDSE